MVKSNHDTNYHILYDKTPLSSLQCEKIAHYLDQVGLTVIQTSEYKALLEKEMLLDDDLK